MLIRGEWTDGCNEETFEVRNPATAALVDRAPLGSAEDVGNAVDAADEALNGWSVLPPRDRGRILFLAARTVRNRSAELAALLTAEQGKPFQEAVDEIRGFAQVLEYYHALPASLHGGYLTLPPYGHALVAHRPLGVCGAIIPWNMPAILMAWKVGPALAAGNTLVLKPACAAPLTCLALAGILQDSGLPAGVLNVVTGSGETVGRAITRHPAIRKVSFTGEVETGRQVAMDAAPTMKRVTLELGGSDPMIVCDDADIADAVEGAVRGRFYNCGQTCTAVKRLYVFESVAEEFIRRLTARIASLQVGNGMEEGVDMGPLINGAARERLIRLVDAVRKRGEGRIVTGGGVPGGGGYERGSFYLPTLVTDLPSDSVLFSEEVFGPVLPVATVSDLDDAIEQANSTRYGLGASIWTKNIETAMRAADEIRAGIVWVNQHLRIPPEVPLGGVKESGIGRENGYRALERYLEERAILIKP